MVDEAVPSPQLAAAVLAGDPMLVPEVLRHLDDAALTNLDHAVEQEVRRRAVEAGDTDAVTAEAFETGFGRDGLAVLPWIEGPYVVCPGGLVSSSRTSHRCRFVSVNDTWVWDCAELICEEKRSAPGTRDGFRAIALVPAHEGMAIDVVSGKLRSGQHSVDKVISFELRAGELVEVSQRTISAAGMA